MILLKTLTCQLFSGRDTIRQRADSINKYTKEFIPMPTSNLSYIGFFMKQCLSKSNSIKAHTPKHTFLFL